MKAQQAKTAVDTAKEVNNDKTLKTKADRDRRLKEKNQNNTKRFIEERKISAMKQGKQREKLKKVHEQQTAELSKDIQLVCTHIHTHTHIYYQCMCRVASKYICPIPSHSNTKKYLSLSFNTMSFYILFVYIKISVKKHSCPGNYCGKIGYRNIFTD